MTVKVQRGVETERLLRLYQMMLEVRRFEERVAADFRDGKIPGVVHLSIGQEAVAAGVSINLLPSDYSLSTHRAHGHMLAKGAPPKELMAEIWGKATGVCGGKGGSMHIAHVASGALGANAIVGGGQPFAAGVGLAIRYRRTGQIVVSYFGDGAIAAGAFHEGAVLASVFSLPILFVAENNHYSETTGAPFHLVGKSIAERLKGYGFRTEQVDGMDAEAVDRATGPLIEWIRAEQRPAVLECDTYRYHGHYEGDPGKYRTAEEVTAWRKRDPIVAIRWRLGERGLDKATLEAIDRKVTAGIAAAAAFAAESPFPQPETTLEGVYAR